MRAHGHQGANAWGPCQEPGCGELLAHPNHEVAEPQANGDREAADRAAADQLKAGVDAYRRGDAAHFDPPMQFRVEAEPVVRGPLTPEEDESIAADDARMAACPDCDDESIRGDHVAQAVTLSNGAGRLLHV